MKVDQSGDSKVYIRLQVDVIVEEGKTQHHRRIRDLNITERLRGSNYA